MTRKYLNQLAQALLTIENSDQRLVTARAVARVLEQANTRFNRDKFMRACEVVDTSHLFNLNQG